MTRCTEFYEKLERDGNFCGLTTRFFKEAMEYWLEYRKDAESNGDKSPKSEREWFKQQRKAAEAHKHKTERFAGTDLAETQPEPPEAEQCNLESGACFDCSTEFNGYFVHEIEGAISHFRQEGMPENLLKRLEAPMKKIKKWGYEEDLKTEEVNRKNGRNY